MYCVLNSEDPLREVYSSTVSNGYQQELKLLDG